MSILAVVAVFAATAIYVLAVVSPAEANFYPGCTFHEGTGFHCPGCGTTRGLHALLNGRLEQAAAYNALMFLFLPILIISVVRSLWSWAWGEAPAREASSRPRIRWMPYLIGGVLLTFWILRNLPLYPFTLLAPHEVRP